MRRLLPLVAAGLLLVSGCGDQPAPKPHHVAAYVALGDSYTAAPGVPEPTGPPACYRSDHNYPSLVAAALRPTSFTDRSCGGATTASMTTSQGAGIPPQFDALGSSTELVTVGIGGNDLGLFGVLIGYCGRLATQDPQGSPCTDVEHKNPRGFRNAFATIRHNVTEVLQGVRRRSPKAMIVAVGYPQIIPKAGRCAAVPLAAGDYRLGRRINRNLDDAVKAAARTAHVHFVNLWGPSAGHDICSDEPWINGVHDAPGRAAPLHPFEVEQRAVARLVVRAVRRAASASPSDAAS